MYNVSIKNISKSFGDTPVLMGIDVDIKAGELFFLLGPSGCGKTTLLRILAGFEKPDQGTVRFDRSDVTLLPPQQRNTSMVFQNYALWPHMSVYQNVAFGLQNRKMPEDRIRSKVTEALKLVRMQDFASRVPNQLSGGQQQRIALARAMVVEPQLLLLDEPLSNLDARLRSDMRAELRRVHQETGVTAVYVTHDQEEALSLADRIAFVNRGILEQVGSPRDLYENPRTVETARFVGQANLVPGTVKNISQGEIQVDTPLGTLCGCPQADEQYRNGQQVQCFFRPEKMSTRGPAGKPVNLVRGMVASALYGGGNEQLTLEAGGQVFLASLAAGDTPIAAGTDLEFAVSRSDVKVMVR